MREDGALKYPICHPTRHATEQVARVQQMLLLLILTITAFALAASKAHATTFSVIGVSTSLGNPLERLSLGEEITIDIRVSSEDEGIVGIFASAFGYDKSVIEFVSGEAVQSVFNPVLVPGLGGFNGIQNLVGGPLSETVVPGYGYRVQFLSGVSTIPFSPQPRDPGLDGVIDGGDAQFRLVFAVVGEGLSEIQIGTGFDRADGVVLDSFEVARPAPTQGEILLVSTPEPGTSLLLGLGLAGLAATGRREAHEN